MSLKRSASGSVPVSVARTSSDPLCTADGSLTRVANVRSPAASGTRALVDAPPALMSSDTVPPRDHGLFAGDAGSSPTIQIVEIVRADPEAIGTAFMLNRVSGRRR